VLVKSGKKITSSAYESILKAGLTEIKVQVGDLEGAFTLNDLVNTSDGEVMAESNSELTADTIAKVIEAGIANFEIFFPEKDDVGPVISGTVRKDAIKTPQEALIEIYRKMRPGDPPTLDTSNSLPRDVLRSPQVRFLARRPPEVQHQDGSARARTAG